MYSWRMWPSNSRSWGWCPVPTSTQATSSCFSRVEGQSTNTFLLHFPILLSDWVLLLPQRFNRKDRDWKFIVSPPAPSVIHQWLFTASFPLPFSFPSTSAQKVSPPCWRPVPETKIHLFLPVLLLLLPKVKILSSEVSHSPHSNPL